MDFIIMLQTPSCTWIFNHERIRETYNLINNSTKVDSEAAMDAQSEPEVKAKMMEAKDELQYCIIDANNDSD